MKKLERNTMVKRILAILLVIATILPYFPASVFAAGEEGNTGNASVQFNAKWSSNNETEEGTTNDTFAGEYSFTLNGAPNGFQNVKLLLETDSATGANDTITIRGISGASAQTSSGTGFAIIDFGNLNQGQAIGGQFGVKFVNTEQVTRKLTVTLSGTYTDPIEGTTKAINMKKELAATVTPATVITPYSADMTWQDYYQNGQTRYRTPTVTPTKHTIYHETYGTDIGFYTSKLEAIYPIKISSQEKTQELKLEVKVNRYSADGTNRLSEGYTIDWNGLDTDLGNPTVTDNDDGSKTYTFIKGTDNGYNATTAFALKDKTYDVKVTYTTPHTNPVTESDAEFRTFVSFESELNTVGYKLEKVYNQTESAEKITENKKLTDTRGINLYSYTPGQDAWVSTTAYSSNIGGTTKITSTDRNNLKAGETVNVNANVYLKFINGDKNSNEVGKINFAQPKLTYIGDDRRTKTINLTADQMKIKTVRKSDTNVYDSAFDDGTTSTAFTDTYTASSNLNVFSIKLNDFVSALKPDAYYYLGYELNLADAGLTETEIENIQNITINFTTSGSGCLQGEDSFILNREVVMATNFYSYMEMELVGEHNTTSEQLNKTEEKTIKLKMLRNPDVIRDTTESRNYVVNSNPVFYVEFPNSGTKYEYDIDPDDISITTSSNIQIDEENIDLVTSDEYPLLPSDSDYLVIPCIGTYTDYLDNEVDISIKYSRKLLDASSTKTYIHSFMLTENENYFSEYRNHYDFINTNGDTPDKAHLETGSFNVVGVNRLTAETYVTKDDIDYKPNPADDDITNDKTEKGLPLLINSNKTIRYNSKISSENETIKNAVIISRLPIANNTDLQFPSNQLIENDYKLPQKFYDTYGNKVNGNAQGSAVTQTSLQNLNILGLYRERVTSGGNQSEEIAQSKYKIYYSTDANATFDSTSFVEYVPGGTNTDFENAKNIKVEITDSNLILQSGQSFVFKYEMTMPNAAGMVGAETAVKYTKSSDSTENTLYSPAAYVINGDENATINVQKGFENYPDGVVPEPYGVNSLAGIEFKLRTSKNGPFLKDSSDNDVVAVTDSTGKAVFTSVPAGRYFLVETTEFAQYSGIGNVNVINVGIGETKDYRAENKLKHGNITINKKWLNNDVEIGNVTFKVSRVNATNETFTFTPVSVTTDDNNQAFVINVPYGTYSITEESGQTGWTPENMNVTTTVNAETVTATYNNVPAKATLQIVKTVPREEKVDNLTFKVTGRGTLAGADKVNINPNSEISFTIGGSNNPANVAIEKSENDTKATITITDLYLGYYSVEETDIPVIEGTDDVTRYPGVSDSAILGANGQTAVVNLVNNHKYGKIVINKTAKLKDGDNYQTISDVSGFQVRVTGHSYYAPNDEINELLTIDEDGHAEIELEVGEYTVTEVPVDGYTTYYGENSSASTTAPTIQLKEHNQTVTQNIYNEHTGVGYVKVIKSLEGITDPNEVISKHIKFAVVGRNVAQQKIGTTIEGNLQGVLIEINQVDTENNVAYGISGPISVGGEYELQEVPSSVPDYYEEYEPTVIQVKTENTTSNPKVVNITNEKSRGNLEIVTTTNPEGGPLTGITYKVTPVKINSDATYTETGASQTVEGSNEVSNPSFAKLENIYAGFYAVEQVTVPEGWKADVKQIVEVPSYNTGYANFEITQKKQVKDNKVIIKKEVLDENDEIATSEYIADAQLNEDESFEVKLTNVNTNEVHYVFTSAANPGVITGLDVGTYRIEEVYKPKYNTVGYFKEVTMLDEFDIPRPVKVPLATTDNTFTIVEEEGTVKDVTIVVDNKINKEFGFGGQDSKDNLNKVVVEEQQDIFVTKAVIYVTDEENKPISGVKFKLFDSNNNQITLSNLGSEFEINDGKLTIKGLPAGVYTLKCTQFPDGYLKPDDKEVIVYSDATQVVRVEVQKNIPRGSLTLSTVFIKKNGEPRYVTRSEYKVVNSATGELVKFVRTPTGNYKKSNTAEASPIVTLKAGPVELQGLELGDYEVGIVGVKKGYGITKDDPEYVTVVENTNKDVVTTVVDRSIVQVAADGATTMYLDANGDLYYIGYISGSQTDTTKFKEIEFPEGVNITKFTYIVENATLKILAIDDKGNVWVYGTANAVTGLSSARYDNGGYEIAIPPICITKNGDLREAYESGVRFVDVQIHGVYGATYLDDQGRIWISGIGSCDASGNNSITFAPKIIQYFVDNNIKFDKLARAASKDNTNYAFGAVDTNGKVWIWGGYTYPVDPDNEYNIYSPKCISNTTPLGDVKIVDLIVRDEVAMALDENGEVWIWGQEDNLQKIVQGGTTTKTPTKIPKSFFGGAKITAIDLNNIYYDYKMATVIDEYGRVWTWGEQRNGELGVGGPGSITIPAPTCISDGANERLYGTEITQLCIGSFANYSPANTSGYVCHVVALDSNNGMWAWGGNSLYGEAGQSIATGIGCVAYPQKMYVVYDEHLEYNLKFEKLDGYSDSNYAIDTEGRVWVWGGNGNCVLGVAPSYGITVPTVLDIPGNPKMIKATRSSWSIGLFVSEDKRVFTSGYYYYPGNGSYKNGDFPITEITEYCPTSIVDVCLMGNTFVVLDEAGQIWTWGGSDGPLGRSSTNQYTKQIISSGHDYVKISGGSYGALALTANGQLYGWKGTSSPSLLVSDKTFVDICGLYAMDSEGHLWYFNYNNYTLLEVTEVTEKMQEDSEYKIAKMINDNVKYGYNLVFEDSNGDVWKTSYEHVSTKMDFGVNGVKGLSATCVLDNDGQIWSYDSNSYEVTNMMSDIKTKNPFYNFKFKHLYSSYATLVNGDMYYVRDMEKQTPTAQMYGNNTANYIDEVIGKRVIQSYGNCFLDEDNHIWWRKTSTEYPIDLCASGNALNGVNIVKFYGFADGSSRYIYYAIDSQGQVWAWGYNGYGYLGNGTTNSSLINDPVRVTGLTGITDIYAAIGKDGKDSRPVIAKDANGNVWAWGYNSRGGIGNGTTNAVTTPFKINVDNKQIISDKINSSSSYASSYVLYTDGSVYRTSGNAWVYTGQCEGATRILDDTVYGNIQVITGNNKTWLLAGTTITPISEEFEAKRAFYYGSYVLVDKQGQYWESSSSRGTYVKDESIPQIVGYIPGYYSTREGSVIDINGVTHGSTNSDVSSIIRDMFGELTEESVGKYIELVSGDSSYSGVTKQVIINGQLWKYTYNAYGIITSYTNYADWPNGDMKNKTIVEFNTMYALDSEGRLYDLNTGKDMTKDEYDVTPAPFKSNNNVINVIRKNPAYGTKFSDVTNDVFATDVDNNVWYFPPSGEAVNISEVNKGRLNDMYGKQIKKMTTNEYAITTDNELWYLGGDYPKFVLHTADESEIIYGSYYTDSEYVIALDSNGKVWVAGKGTKLGLESQNTNGELICLNDVEGSSLNGVVISKATLDTYYGEVIAIDNTGKVWMWGVTGLTTPTCVTDIESSALDTAYQSGITMVDFIKRVNENGYTVTYVVDSDGQLWEYGNKTLKIASGGTMMQYDTTDKIVDFARAARLTESGKLYIRYPQSITIDGRKYPVSTSKYRNINDIVPSANVPTVEKIFDAYTNIPRTGTNEYVTLANTANGVYVIKCTYNNSSPYNNYTCTATLASTAKIVKTVTPRASEMYSIICLDENGDLWISGQKNYLFNSNNEVSYDRVDYECITTNSNSPLYGKKFTDIQFAGSDYSWGGVILGITTDNEAYYIKGYWSDKSPRSLSYNDSSVSTVYGADNVDNAHRIQIFNEPSLTYSNGKFFLIDRDGSAYETPRNYLEHYYNGVGIIDEIIGEYDFKNTDGKMYRITPTGVNKYSIGEITSPMEFTTATPGDPITVDGATIVKQVKHKALDSEGNLYVWDTHTGLIDETEGVVCLTDTVNSVDPVYNEGNGWTVIQGSNF